MYRCMRVSISMKVHGFTFMFFCLISIGDNFCDFLFVSRYSKAPPKRSWLWARNFSGSKFLASRVDPHFEGCKIYCFCKESVWCIRVCVCTCVLLFHLKIMYTSPCISISWIYFSKSRVFFYLFYDKEISIKVLGFNDLTFAKNISFLFFFNFLLGQRGHIDLT